MNRAPWSATATLLMCRGSILRQSRLAGETKGFAKRTAPVAGESGKENRPSARTFHERVRDLEAERKKGPKALSQ